MSDVKRTMRELDAKFAEKSGVTDYEFPGDELRVDIAVNDGDIVKAENVTVCSVLFWYQLLFRSAFILAGETPKWFLNTFEK